jgi:hypothetical protein
MDPYIPAIERAHMLAMLDLAAWGLLALALLLACCAAECRWGVPRG